MMSKRVTIGSGREGNTGRFMERTRVVCRSAAHDGPTRVYERMVSEIAPDDDGDRRRIALVGQRKFKRTCRPSPQRLSTGLRCAASLLFSARRSHNVHPNDLYALRSAANSPPVIHNMRERNSTARQTKQPGKAT
uniref:Uncharacterized protein n=2 Tax=Plectus sambesii TaxID=2011161 RepID=A0A914UMQ6_9BILA